MLARCGHPHGRYRGVSGSAIAMICLLNLLVLRSELAQAMLRGVNAAVVGILLAALFDPIFTSSVKAPVDFAIALGAFAALMLWKVPAWAVVALTAAAGALATSL